MNFRLNSIFIYLLLCSSYVLAMLAFRYALRGTRPTLLLPLIFCFFCLSFAVLLAQLEVEAAAANSFFSRNAKQEKSKKRSRREGQASSRYAQDSRINTDSYTAALQHPCFTLLRAGRQQKKHGRTHVLQMQKKKQPRIAKREKKTSALHKKKSDLKYQ